MMKLFNRIASALRSLRIEIVWFFRKKKVLAAVDAALASKDPLPVLRHSSPDQFANITILLNTDTPKKRDILVALLR